MLTLNIMLRVKFRAFFIDFARFTKLVKVGISAQNPLNVSVEDFNEDTAPASAKKVVDQRGVVLKVW